MRDDTPTPADAFAVLGSEVRLAILDGLWAADGPLSFTALYERVPLSDSAQFNYHLRRLMPQFVRQDDDGYHLEPPGEVVVRAIVAGTIAGRPDRETLAVPGACIDCGGALAACVDSHVAIYCTACDRLHSRYPFPPAGHTDRTDADLVAAYDRWVRHSFGLAASGVCPECAGPIETTVAVPEDDDRAAKGHSLVTKHLTLSCPQCRYRCKAGLGMTLLADSDVVWFYREHGIDITDRPYWTLDWAISDAGTVALDDGGFRVEIRLDGDCLQLTLDADRTVRSVERIEGRATDADVTA